MERCLACEAGAVGILEGSRFGPSIHKLANFVLSLIRPQNDATGGSRKRPSDSPFYSALNSTPRINPQDKEIALGDSGNRRFNAFFWQRRTLGP